MASAYGRQPWRISISTTRADSAAAPSAAPVLVQLRELLFIQLANWRSSWRTMVVLGIVAPTFSVALLSRLVDTKSASFLSVLLVGNIVLMLMFENQNKVAGHFAFMRVTRTLAYLFDLPIRRGALITATALAFFLMSVPAIVATSLLGAELLDVSLDPSPVLVVAAPLAAISLAGVGAIIGVLARTPEEAGSATLLVNVVLLAAGPVIVPADRLPDVVEAVGNLNPAAYAASALRQGLIGPVTGRVIVDIAVLGVFSGVSLAIAGALVGKRVE